MTMSIPVQDIAGHLGESLGSSAWHEITQKQVDMFADATWDHQWIHVDEARAAAGPYGGTIAHGFLTISLTPALMGEIFEITGIDMMVNQGLRELKLRAPVPVGSRVRLTATLTGHRPRPRGFTELALGLVFEVETGEKVQKAATGEIVLLVHEPEAA
ncbi:MaoC family dehydratase [Hamadaea tsunoensis]|uniref:MaoC family dehydratase n=1 Tax=Hamadaea tsunoensis TaxID=53368 RepID=UPI0003F6E3B7|nr:MaoC family dehydratase [Hamadaea tsunoensis]